jgi:predicted DCC family thiol-disulfide oxidoreductase YuxK
LSSEQPALTVYFDGSCPLCQAEIAHYRKQEGANRICFHDASLSHDQVAPDLAKADAMARFHVRQRDGQLLSGAAAFVSIWSLLPRWRWAGRIAALPGMTALLEFFYRLFLPLRPKLAWIFGRIQNWRR